MQRGGQAADSLPALGVAVSMGLARKLKQHDLNELKFNILGRKGEDAYIVHLDETGNLRRMKAELEGRRDIAEGKGEKFICDTLLSTIHFEQRLGDWLDEVKRGFQLGDGDYLDYAFVALYRAGLSGKEVMRFMGIKRPRGGHYSVKWPKIRSEILKRDDYTCQECGSHQNLEVHHIGWWWDNTPANLITLCQKCHKENETP